jgi:hypothetical protein
VAIKTRNMKTKNKDLDSWYTKLRAPYERVFSQREQRVRYVGIAKIYILHRIILSEICQISDFNSKNGKIM